MTQSDFNVNNTSFKTSCVSGAFYWLDEWNDSARTIGTNVNNTNGSYDAFRKVPFQASRSWSGTSQSIGSGSSINILNPYKVAYCFIRLS